MDVKKLVTEIETPNLHQTLLGDFEGPYSLGVGRDKASSKPVLMLLVPPDAMQAFPEYVTVAGESVPVVVQRTFKPPVPLQTRPGEGG
jgi:hypothetical protein